MKYWYRYSTLDWEASVIKALDTWTPRLGDPDWADQYHGPFDSAQAARKEVRRKIHEDIAEFREMLHAVNGPLERRGGAK